MSDSLARFKIENRNTTSCREQKQIVPPKTKRPVHKTRADKEE
ncbi:MAG TPA: hypothetical protein O0X97_03390 [Methanocorpusculum sp.]|nr:hypothetical protein [Methanocorpusculum sp.]